MIYLRHQLIILKYSDNNTKRHNDNLIPEIVDQKGNTVAFCIFDCINPWSIWVTGLGYHKNVRLLL